MVNSHHGRTQAERTVAILQEAAANGVPVLIPGAYVPRVGRPGAQLSAATPPEAGGAPRQGREAAQHQGKEAARKTFIARLRHLLLHRA
jgi:hypothetical protein